MKLIEVTIKAYACVGGKEFKEAVFSIELPYSEETMAWAEENCYEGKPVVFEREDPKAQETTEDVLNALLGVE